MTLVNSAITGLVALVGVLLGGYLSLRNQERLWARDHARQWRDIRLSVYRDFLGAYRQYLAFTVEPSAKICATPHPERPATMMPRFDAVGRPYKERVDAASIAARLVSGSSETTDAITQLSRCARAVAASRATHDVEDMPPELFVHMFSAQDAVLVAFRRELGLPPAPGTDS